MRVRLLDREARAFSIQRDQEFSLNFEKALLLYFPF